MASFKCRTAPQNAMSSYSTGCSVCFEETKLNLMISHFGPEQCNRKKLHVARLRYCFTKEMQHIIFYTLMFISVLYSPAPSIYSTFE